MGLGTLETCIVAGVVFALLFALMYFARTKTPDPDQDLKLEFSSEITKNRNYSISSVGNGSDVGRARQDSQTGHYTVKVYDPIGVKGVSPKMSGSGQAKVARVDSMV